MTSRLSKTNLALLLAALTLTGTIALTGCGDSEDSGDKGAAQTQPGNGSEQSTNQTSGVDRGTAEKIALAAVGSGTVTDGGPEDDRGAAWEIEVTRPDGIEIDVLVAADGSVIDQIKRGQSADSSQQSDSGAGGDGASTTGGGSGPISRKQASQAALDHIGAGRVTYVSREDDRGAAWEIEITRPDGSEVDVLVAADGRIIK